MTRLGPYLVVGPLGSGGMSELNLARAQDGTLVVLKRQIMEDDDPFLVDEGNLGLRLSHPGLVQTRELFYEDGRPVLALTYVPGVSLASMLAAGPLSPASVCDIGMQIADALDALHQATDARGNPLNIIHRDVTPMNILVGFDGRARLIDLGIARYVNSQAPRTKVGDVRGTLHYLAPEVVKGGLHSRASDMWSLGVSLFEAAMGRVAIERDDMASVLDAITNQRVLALRPGETLDIRVRHALAQLVNPEPRCRPAHASDAAAILRIHAAEHVDAAAETVARVSTLLGRPAQFKLADGADAAAKTAVLSQAELLFGATHENSDDDVEAAPGARSPFSLPPTEVLPSDSLDLDSMTETDPPPPPPVQFRGDPFGAPADAPPLRHAPAADPSGWNHGEFDLLDDDEKTAAQPSPLAPRPVSALGPPAIGEPALGEPGDRAFPMPVSALHEAIVPPARSEDSLPQRAATSPSTEEEKTHAAHPIILQDLAQKSVMIASAENPPEGFGVPLDDDAAFDLGPPPPAPSRSPDALQSLEPLPPSQIVPPAPSREAPLAETTTLPPPELADMTMPLVDGIAISAAPKHQSRLDVEREAFVAAANTPASPNTVPDVSRLGPPTLPDITGSSPTARAADGIAIPPPRDRSSAFFKSPQQVAVIGLLGATAAFGIGYLLAQVF